MRKHALPSFDKWSFFSQIFLGFLLWGSFSHAQPQIAQPLGPDNTLANSSLATVNVAMIECSPAVGGGNLSAIIWGDASGTNLYLEHTGGQSFTLPISNAASLSQPDVILSDDSNNPGVDYIAVICYQDNNGDIIVENYLISGIAGTMIANPIGFENLGAGAHPKIDGFANGFTPIFGLPAMDVFVVVWEKTNLNDIGIYASEVSDVSNPIFQNTYTNAGVNPDVAAVRDVATNRLYACVVCFNTSSPPPYGTGLYYVYDIEVSATPSTPPIITNLGLGDYPRPRIEGMALYKQPAPKWSVVKFVDFNHMNYYTDLTPSNPINIIPTFNNYAVAIAAGPGPFVPYNVSDIMGNRQVTLAWAGVEYETDLPKVVSMAFDENNNPLFLLSPPYPFPPSIFATVNGDPIAAIGNYTEEYEVAIAASCNSGKAFIAAWWNAALGQIRYKLALGNNYAFKPTDVEASGRAALSFTVFPNPAANRLGIKYSGLSIKSLWLTNDLGQKVLEVPFKEGFIDISSLPSGHYFISVQTKEHFILTRPLIISR